MLPVPVLLQGGCHVDARGSISFVNGFTFAGVERFYWIQSNHVGMQRGWVGHQREHKWFTVVAGEVQVAVVKPDDWHSPRSDLPVARYVLSAVRPQVLHVPCWSRHHHLSAPRLPRTQEQGTKNKELRTKNPHALAILMVFSSGTIVDAPNDDFRFPVSQWPLGTI